MVYSKNTVYVFVLYVMPRRRMMGKAKNYLFIPSLDLKQWIESGDFETKTGDSDIINVFVYPDEGEGKWRYRNKGKTIDLTPYWNNFEMLEDGT